MNVSECCKREVDLAEPSESVRAAAQRMGARNVGTLVVVDGERRVLGIVTDRDLALRVVARGADANEVTVEQVMTPRPAVVREHEDVVRALAVMRERAARRLPVVDPRGRVAGIISADDVLGLVTRELQALEDLVAETSPEVLADREA